MADSSRHFDYDVAVIGGGSAGYAAARNTAAAGLRTVVVEGGKDVGGLCILRGCMPTKALLYSAEVLHLAKNARSFGIWARQVEPDFAAVMARKNRLIKEFADYREQQLNAGRFGFIRGHAEFIDDHTIAIDASTRVTAGSFILCTGSKVAASPLPALNQIGYITSDEALDLAKLPKSMIVLGGGAVAVEFAQFFSRFGVQITLVQRSEHILRDEDTDAAKEIEKVFRREGMTIFTGTTLCEAGLEHGLKKISFQHQGQMVHAAAEEIFFGLGRVPNTDGLGLEKLGMQIEYGRLLTNSEMQTSIPNIYAAGDCTGLHEIVHIAIQQGEIAAHNIVHPDARKCMDYRLFTSVTFTDPQVAHTGLTEKEARVQKRPYLVASYPFNDHGKSMIMDALDGFVKLLADPETGELLGGCCVGPMGGELIHEIVAAMAKRMTAQELAAMPHYHPTLAEIWTYPAEELAALRIGK